MTVSMDKLASFLYLEAQFCDEHRYDEWLAMWDDGEILYWIPANRDDVDPARFISMAYEGRQGLEDRIFRLKSRWAHSQRPRSKMRRLVSNIQVESDDGETIQVAANFIFTEVRAGHQDVFNGRFVYKLRERDGRFTMVQKKVLLVNNDEFIDNLTFLV